MAEGAPQPRSGPPSVDRSEPALSLSLAHVSKSPEARSCHWPGRPYIRLLRGRVFLKGRLTRARGGSRPQGLPKLPWLGPLPAASANHTALACTAGCTWGEHHRVTAGRRALLLGAVLGHVCSGVHACAGMCLCVPAGAWEHQRGRRCARRCTVCASPLPACALGFGEAGCGSPALTRYGQPGPAWQGSPVHMRTGVPSGSASESLLRG